MSLIAFNSDKHQKALDYFLYSAGHPICKLDKSIEDIDLTFRFIAVEEFELDPWVSDDPNGCFIAVLDPSPENLTLIVCLDYFNEAENQREVFLRGAGEALYDTSTNMIIWEIDPQSLDLSSLEEFEAAEKEKPADTK